MKIKANHISKHRLFNLVFYKLRIVDIIFIVIFIPLFAFNADCQNIPVKKLSFHLKRTIKIPMNKKGTYAFLFHTFIDTIGKESLACLFMTKPTEVSMGIYDIYSGKEVFYSELSPLKGKVFTQFRYLNKDSVFFSFSNSYGLYDSTLILTNQNVDYIRYYDLCDLPVRCSQKHFISKDSVCIPKMGDIHNGFIINNNNILIPLNRYNRVYETGFYPQYVTPSAIDLNLISNKTTPYFFHFPISSYLKGDGFSCAQTTQGLVNSFISSSASTPIVYQTDFLSGKSKKFCPKSSLIDTIYTVEKFQTYSIYGEKSSKYSSIFTNYTTHQYARLLVLPPYPHSNVEVKNKIHHGLMIMDSTFNIIAEDRIPYGIGVPILFSSEGLWFYDYELLKTIADTHYLHLFEVLPANASDLEPQYAVKEQKEEITKNTLYFKNPNLIPQKSALVVAIPVAKTCGPCLKSILETLKSVKQNPHIFPYLLFENEWEYKAFTKDYNLSDFSNVTIDAKGEYLKYIPHFTNAKLLFMEKGSIKKEVQETLENEAEILLMIKGFKGKG